ncbi:hypothetical protein ASF98_18470 [Arthrobacter sp. Leaf337]|uniref:hypothetical protein n=1 Tax=Arthrobacter sp. Leaf337 TaxID=1736342 RepID=UPI0006F993E3|nr:hypothetical protein [Arthrobacter sp. Leaf337]KQR80282.1 hypothetical protein ASF98_18470 [Arthrobacter sp. Leaf337]
MTTPDTQTLHEELARAGTAHKTATERLETLRSRRAVLVAQGFKAGIQATELAGHAGLSRQRLYLVRDIGNKQLEASAAPQEITSEELLKSLTSLVTELPSAEREKATTQADLQRLVAQVAADGQTPVSELARLAGVSPEWTRKIRLQAGVKPRRYSPAE